MTASRTLCWCLALASLWSTGRAYVPASNSPSSVSETNATLVLTWTSQSSRGVFQDGLITLQEANETSSSAGIRQGNSSLGVLVKFNETTAAGQNATNVPFFALISCDRNETSASNATASATTSSALPSATTGLNSTVPANSTASTNTTEINVFNLARSLNASGVVLYSIEAQTCQLSPEYLMSNESGVISVWTTRNQNSARILLAQFNNVPANGSVFNSTQLSQAADRLLGSLTNASIDSPYLPANITTQANSTNGSSIPIYGSIGPAPTSPSATGTARPSAQPSNQPSSALRLSAGLSFLLLAAGASVLA